MAAKKNQGGGDERFVKVKKDPRFWEMPEQQHKIKIDKRFQSMFHDERFKMKYTVDKRGRPINQTSSEDLKRFYNLSDSEHSDQEGAEKDEGKKKKKKKKSKAKSKAVETKDDDDLGDGKQPIRAVGDDDVVRIERPAKGVKVSEKGEDEDEEALGHSSSDGSEEEEDEEEDEEALGESDVASEEEEEESGLSSDEDDSGPDLARGKGNVESSSDEEDEDEVSAILRREAEEIEHDWGELCKDAPRADDVSRRVAVCNMDWDRMKAKDLLALFNSFKPKGGVVLSVKIYPSDYGKERMQQEQSQCPVELMALPEDPEKDTEQEKVYREKMRDYQFKRLKYYYAVVECDSLDTAAKIYEECDGFEYESSCSILDLRFIPDEVTFEEEPTDLATDVDLAAYTPKNFTSTAAATSKVQLTWDETDHERTTAMSKKFNKDELLDMDFNAYLASSSEDEEEDRGPMEVQESDDELPDAGANELEDKPEDKPKKERTGKIAGEVDKPKKERTGQIAKYKEMLKSIQDKEKQQEDKGVEMEITWVPGLKETAEQLVKKKLEGKDEMTPWEEFLEKKKDKKKQKKTKKKQTADESASEDDIPSDVDLNDPFFAEELGSAAELKKKTKGKKKNKVEEEERTPEEEEELEKRKAEMALLMDDGDDDGHKHFNYDKIVEEQNLSKKKRKKMMKEKPLEEDEFQVDVKDPRFQAMFTSHLYNLDPSDPGYKKTKATQSILQEKQRRREQRSHQAAPTGSEATPTQATPTQDAHSEKREPGGEKKETGIHPDPAAVSDTTQKAMDPGLSMLIKSIKNKTQQFQTRKKQKTV